MIRLTDGEERIQAMQRPVTMALVWFFSLAGLGTFFPFFSMYLHENAGLSSTQVGVVLAIVPLVGIFAHPFWGQVADRTGSRARVLALIALATALGYAVLALPRGFGAIALATAGLALFSAALLPMTVSVTLALARDAGPHAFGLVRVWGTVGFLFAVQGFPLLLDAWQADRGLAHAPDAPEPGMHLMFIAGAALTAIGGLIALALPRKGAVSLRAPQGDWRRLLRHGPYVRVLVFVLLSYLFFQGPMTLFPLFIRSLGGTLDSVSRMWIPMLLLEIPLIALAGQGLKRFGARGLLGIGVFAGGLRWLVCGLTQDLAWVFPVQLLHGVVVTGLILGGPLYVEQVVPERLRSTGQTLLAMMGVCIGGIASNLATGWLIEHVGASAPYVIGGAGGIALALLLPLLLPRPQRPPPEPGEQPFSPSWN
jgi:PPP family 3-phenylpropionic acid transporter